MTTKESNVDSLKLLSQIAVAKHYKMLDKYYNILHQKPVDKSIFTDDYGIKMHFYYDPAVEYNEYTKNHVASIKYLPLMALIMSDANEGLMYSAKYGFVDGIKYFIRKGAKEFDRAMILASFNNHLSAVEELSRYADLRYALVYSTLGDCIQIFDKCIERGVENFNWNNVFPENNQEPVNDNLTNIERAQIVSAENGSLKIFSRCKDLGATRFDDAMVVAAFAGQPGIVEMCLRYGATSYKRSLDNGIDAKSIDCVRLILRSGIRYLTINELNGSLGFASSMGNVEAVNLLISVGADDMDSALIIASRNGHANCVKIFLMCGATNRIRQGTKIAAKKGYLNVLSLFLLYGQGFVDLNETLRLAAKYGHLDCVKLLVRFNAHNLNSAMVYAANNGHIEVVRFLKIKGANDYNSAFIAAEENQHFEVMQQLMDWGADDIFDIVMSNATRNGRLGTLRHFESKIDYYLLERVILMAVKHDRFEIVRYLINNLDKYLDIFNVQGSSSTYTLKWNIFDKAVKTAAEHNKKRMLKLLLKHISKIKMGHAFIDRFRQYMLDDSRFDFESILRIFRRFGYSQNIDL